MGKKIFLVFSGVLLFLFIRYNKIKVKGGIKLK